MLIAAIYLASIAKQGDLNPPEKFKIPRKYKPVFFNQWAVPEKKTTNNGGGLSSYFFGKAPGNYNFFTFWKFKTKQNSTTGSCTKLCYIS